MPDTIKDKEDGQETVKSKDDVLKIVDGTTESKARDFLGVSRRNITGVLDQSHRIRFLTLSSRVMKPISILNSALGLTISILLIVEKPFWSPTFWVSIFIGLIVGIFFELWSTNSEHSFVEDELAVNDTDKGINKTILIAIKTYAVIMVIISAYNLPDYIIVQKSKSIEDNGYIQSRLSQIERLKKDKDNSKDSSVLTTIYQDKINRLKKEVEEIRAEKTIKLVQNSTSKFQNKRKDALKTLKSINSRIEEKNKEITTAEQNMVKSANGKTKKQLYEDEISTKEDEIEKERDKLKAKAKNSQKSTIGISIMLGVLFIFLELGGTFASILARRTIMNSISSEESYKENITNHLFNNKIALSERNTRLKATKISSDIEQNKVMTKVIEYESKAMAQNHELTERARLAEIDRENARLLTETKMQELESNQMLALTDGVVKKLEGLDTVHERINNMLRRR